jgi:hypothetical protein
VGWLAEKWADFKLGAAGLADLGSRAAGGDTHLAASTWAEQEGESQDLTAAEVAALERAAVAADEGGAIVAAAADKTGEQLAGYARWLPILVIGLVGLYVLQLVRWLPAPRKGKP